MTKKELRELIQSMIKEYTGTGSSGGNSTDGNDIPSQRPFSDDEEEVGFYTDQNMYGGDGGHYKNEPATTGYNRVKFTKFEENKMKKSDIIKLIKEIISEVKPDAYGDATNLTKGLNVAKSRFTKTGRPPGVWEEKEEVEVEDSENVEIEDEKNVTININEDEIENNALRIYKAIINMDNKSGGNYYKNLFGTLRKGFEFRDIDPNNITGDQAAQLNLFHTDLIRASKGKERLVPRNFEENKNQKNMKDLKNPKKADLDKDGKLSDYEKTRGAAIEKNIEEDIGDDISKAEDEVAKAMQTKADAEAKLADANKKKADAEKSALQEENPEFTNDVGKDDYMDDEGRFAKSQIHKMAHYANKLTDMLSDDMEQLPSWVQSKITMASNYMSMVYHYLEYEFSRKGDHNLMENMDKYRKRSNLMEGAMKQFFDMFDQNKTDEEIVQNYAQKGIEVPIALVSNARKNWEKAKELELAMDMGEKDFKNTARDIVNNPEGNMSGMEPSDEKQLASGLFNETKQ